MQETKQKPKGFEALKALQELKPVQEVIFRPEKLSDLIKIINLAANLIKDVEERFGRPEINNSKAVYQYIDEFVNLYQDIDEIIKPYSSDDDSNQITKRTEMLAFNKKLDEQNLEINIQKIRQLLHTTGNFENQGLVDKQLNLSEQMTLHEVCLAMILFAGNNLYSYTDGHFQTTEKFPKQIRYTPEDLTAKDSDINEVTNYIRQNRKNTNGLPFNSFPPKLQNIVRDYMSHYPEYDLNPQSFIRLAMLPHNKTPHAHIELTTSTNSALNYHLELINFKS